MRYCDKCNAAITSGGGRSANSWRGAYLCEDCLQQETKSNSLITKLLAGPVIGIALVGATAYGLNAICGELSDAMAKNILIGVEVLAIITFILSKIGSRKLEIRLLRCFCGLIAFSTFWMSLVLGIGMYFILKYA